MAASFGSATLDPDIAGTAPPVEQPGEFVKGLKSGALSMGGQLQTFGGHMLSDMGATGVGQNLTDAGAANAQEAAAVGPRVSSLRDIHSVGDALDYGAGFAGQAIPAVGLGLGAGAVGALAAPVVGAGAGLGALAGATLAQAPFSAGDMMQQRAAQGLPANDLRDTLGGLGQSAAMNIVPGAVGGKLVGAGVKAGEQAAERAVAKQAEGSLLGATLKGGAENFAGGAASDAIGQQTVNPDQQFDMGRIAEAGAGGAILGAPLGALGHVADTAHGAADTIKALPGQALDAVKAGADKLKPKDEAAAPAPDAADGLIDTLKTQGDDTLPGLSPEEKAALADPTTPRSALSALASKTGDALVSGTQQAMTAIANRLDLSPETRQTAAALAQTAGDAASQVKAKALAATVQARDAASGQIDALGNYLKNTGLGKKYAENKAGVQDFTSQLNDLVAKGDTAGAQALIDKTAPSGGTKQTADTSGLRATIAEHILPNVTDAVKSDPDLQAKFVGHLQDFITEAQKPDANPIKIEQAVQHMRPLIDGDAEGVLAKVYQAATGDNAPDSKFLAHLEQSKAAGDSHAALQSAVEAALPEGHGMDTGKLTNQLVQWARGEGRALGTPEQRLKDQQVHALLKDHLGDKADGVYDALQKHLDGEAERHELQRDAEGGFDAEEQVKGEKFGPDEMQEQGSTKTVLATRYTPSGKPISMMSPEAHRAMYPNDKVGTTGKVRERPAEDMIKKLQEDPKNEGKEFKFVTEAKFHNDPDRSTTRGYIVAEEAKKEGQLRDSDLREARLDTSKAAGSPSRIEVAGADPKLYGSGKDGLILDAVKLARKGMDALKATKASDGATDSARLARGFFEAYSQLTDKFGAKPKLPNGDNTVIGYIGKKPFTVADATRVSNTTFADAVRDAKRAGQFRAAEAHIDDLRQKYMAASDPREKSELKAEGIKAKAKLEQDRADARDREITRGERDDGAPPSVADELLQGEGKYDLNKDENIHKVEAVKGEGDGNELAVQDNRSDLRARMSEGERQAGRDAVLAAHALQDRGGAAGKLGERLEGLLSKYSAMSAKDRAALDEVIKPHNGEPRKPSSISAVIDGETGLIKKYEGTKAGMTKREAMAERAKDNIKGAPKDKAAAENPIRFDKDGKALNAKPKTEAETARKAAGDTEDMFGGRGSEGLTDDQRSRLDDIVASGGAPGFESPQEAMSFLRAAKKRYDELSRTSVLDSDKHIDKLLDHYDDIVGPQAVTHLHLTEQPWFQHLSEERQEMWKDRADAVKEGSPDPKAEAAKKAALDKAVTSSDPALEHELKTTDNAAGLQRTAEHLASKLKDLDGLPDEALHPDVRKANDAATDGLVGMIQHTEAGDENMVGGAHNYAQAQLDRVLAKASPENKPLIQAMKDRLSAFHASMTDAMGRKVENDAVIEHINSKGDGKTTLGEVMSTIVGSTKDSARSIIAQAIKRIAPDMPVQISDLGSGVFGRHASGLGIDLNGRTPDLAATTALHEGVHAATVNAMEHNSELMAKANQLLDHVTRIDPSIREEYGNVNAKEFIAEGLANPSLQAKLRAIPASDAVQRWLGANVHNMWEAFSKFVKDALGLTGKEADSALAQIMDLAGTIMKQNPDAPHGNGGKQYMKALDTANHRLDELVHEDNLHDSATAYSMQTANPKTPGVHPNTRRDVEDYIHKVLGNAITVAWKNLPHAGEFVPGFKQIASAINMSVHALNPMGVAAHEAMHGFFKGMRDTGNHKVNEVLTKAASQLRVQDWMENHFKNEPGVLKQIRGDAEERAAYMFQLYQTEPGFRNMLNPQAKTIFGKIAEFTRSVLGIWSNDQRAMAIMDHFQSGEYGKRPGRPDIGFMLGEGTNRGVETLRAMGEPLSKLGDTLFGAGSARLRDTGLEGFQKIADLVKPRLIDKNKDVGYIQAARTEFTSRLHKFGEEVGPLTTRQQELAAEHLQNPALGKSGDAAVDHAVEVTRATLQDFKTNYLDKHVQMGDLGKNYFPRIWDPKTLTAKSAQFRAMIDKYNQLGHNLDADQLLRKFVANEGNNYAVMTDKPGMQNAKTRELSFISHEDAAPFLSKNLYQTMSSYMSQGTRKVEFAKRFGENNEILKAHMEDAKKNGATADQLATVDRYMRGVTGSLGDNINPEARRLMGNAIVYQNLRLLPLAIFSSAVDPMGIAVRGGTIGDAWKAFKLGMKDIPKNFKKFDPANKSAHEALAETLGVIENATLAHSMSSMFTQGMTGSIGRKVNDTLFRFNMMEQMNRSMRIAATQSAMKFIERHATGVEGAKSERFLAELNLKKSDVKKTATGELDVSSDKMRNAINNWVDGAVLRPDAADKPIWFNDPHFSLISHLKQFTYSFQHTIIQRVVHEAKQGNYKPAAMLASYVPIMIAADAIKGMIVGGGSQPAYKQDWGPGDYIASGIERAGLFGVGQFAVDAAGDIKHGGSGLGMLAGPTLQQLGDGLSVLGGRERFSKFALDSMPANALYKQTLSGPEGE